MFGFTNVDFNVFLAVVNTDDYPSVHFRARSDQEFAARLGACRAYGVAVPASKGDEHAAAGLWQFTAQRLIAMRQGIHNHRAFGGGQQYVAQANQSPGRQHVGSYG